MVSVKSGLSRVPNFPQALSQIAKASEVLRAVIGGVSTMMLRRALRCRLVCEFEDFCDGISLIVMELRNVLKIFVALPIHL